MKAWMNEMTTGFPLVRASDIAPFLLWLRNSGRDIDETLKLAYMPVAPWEEPDRLIPLLGAFAVMRSLSTQEGPDIACRVVSETAILDLGELGEAMLKGRTARNALKILCTAIDRHSSHERFMMVTTSSGAVIREYVNLDLDNETRHIVQQYVAALILSLFRMTGLSGHPFERVEMTPHPQFGLAHLESIFGVAPVATSSGMLALFISNDVLDRPFLSQFRNKGCANPVDEQAHLTGMTSKTSAKLFVTTLLEQWEEGQPLMAQMAEMSGFSRRTMQRILAEEDTSFSDLVDEVRRARALDELTKVSRSIGSIAAELGYSGQPAFVRAVRRWTGRSPREFRRLMVE
jgi:AraC-like DNA-binding protein